MVNTLRFYNPGVRSAWKLFVWSLLASAAVYALQYLLSKLIFPIDSIYIHFLKQSSIVRIGGGFAILSVVLVISWANNLISAKQEEVKRRQEVINMAKDAEMNNLRTQIQPHFLFNSLNSISSLISIDSESARDMINKLSDFMRYTLKGDFSQLIPIKEELRHLHQYLDIEKQRFGERLKIDVQIANELMDHLVPFLIVQPVVENAIKFGLYGTTEEVKIGLKVFTMNNLLYIEVSNPYEPESQRSSKGTGFGLSSIRRRLFLLYSRNDLLSTTSDKGIFVTSIKIPIAQ